MAADVVLLQETHSNLALLLLECPQVASCFEIFASPGTSMAVGGVATLGTDARSGFGS
jgi:hypothetical protein